MWRYKILKHSPGTVDPYYAVHEVFYDDNGKAYACTEDPVTFIGETAHECCSSLQQALLDGLLNGVTDYDAIPEEGALDPKKDLTLEDVGVFLRSERVNRNG